VLEWQHKTRWLGLKVSVSLVDSLTGIQMWGDSYKTDLNPAELIGFRGGIASTIVGKSPANTVLLPKPCPPESKRASPCELTTVPSDAAILPI
jgi:hypothetical protein